MTKSEIIPIRDVMPIGRARRPPPETKAVTMGDLLLLAARAGDIAAERHCGVAEALTAAIVEEMDALQVN
jgi:hypothetical protein